MVLFYLFSSIQLSYSVNTIGNIIQDMKNETEQNQQKIRLINEYMETKNVSNQLQIQIREYLNYYWREQEAEQHMSLQQDIVNELPLYLKSKLLKEANQNIIKECPLFKKFEFSDHLTKNIYKILQPLNLLPESLVETEKAKQDIAGPCIYFVEKGAVALQSNLSNSAVVIDEYDENEYFGLRDFIQGQETKLVYKSTQFSRLILLPLVDFMQILKNSQEDKEIFQDIKDSLIDKKIGLFCYACKEYTHSLISCQLTHYAPNYERVIKSYAFPVNQPRKKLTSRAKPHSCFSSWLDQALLHETAENYIEDNSKMMDGLYEIHSDIDTQEEYEEIEHPRQETRMNDEEGSTYFLTLCRGKTQDHQPKDVPGDVPEANAVAGAEGPESEKKAVAAESGSRGSACEAKAERNGRVREEERGVLRGEDAVCEPGEDEDDVPREDEPVPHQERLLGNGVPLCEAEGAAAD